MDSIKDDILNAIKSLQGITDDSKDTIITYYINKTINDIEIYCECEYQEKMFFFVVEKVKSIIENGATSNNKEVKAVSRGDTKVEYDTSKSTASSSTVFFTDSEKEYLKQFKKNYIKML